MLPRSDSGNHGEVHEFYPHKQDDSLPAFLHVVHGGNVARRIKRSDVEVDLSELDARFPIRDEARRALVASVDPFRVASLAFESVMNGDTLILCYHGISESWPSPSAIPVDRLERQLRHLLERGYRGTTFSEAVLSRPRGKTVAVTFDDGYRSIGEHGVPLLSRLGLPATLFVPTDWVGRDTPMAWKGIDRYVGERARAELLPLSWAEIASLSDAGWEIGSHTRSHPDLTTLEDDALARRAGRVAGGSRATAGPALPRDRIPVRLRRCARRPGGRASRLPRRCRTPRPHPSPHGHSSGRGWGSSPTIRTPAFERRLRPGAGGSSARGSARKSCAGGRRTAVSAQAAATSP